MGKALAAELEMDQISLRLVSRNPVKTNDGVESVAADLLDAEQTMNAINGSDVVFLTAGIPYRQRLWQAHWPVLMRNVIDACRKQSCLLVFFDNVYMLERDAIPHMRENSLRAPSSLKGQVRTQIEEMLLSEMQGDDFDVILARSADFYGPGTPSNSVLRETVIKPLSKGSKANWLMDASKIHSYTYIPDATRGMRMLAEDPSTYNQVWHLPTSTQKWTGEDWIDEIASQFGVVSRYRIASKNMIRFMGLMIPDLRETVEMLYQYDRDYFFDSEKFNRHFNFNPTSYEDGIREIMEMDFPEKVKRNLVAV
jgi:nucleoside-diphosphate-sugar epimerase